MDNWPRIEELFLQALDRPLAERPGFLQSACADDAGLLREVEEMLEADASGTHGVFGGSVRQALSSYDVEDMEGREIGVYRVVREIGRGGMGAVFLAVRADDEFDKQVAIKIIKRGMDSAELLRRFRHERQILARLDHPYIARLIDGGTLPDGRPYFVMDYVDGKPIDQFCVERQLSVEQRARLFCKVCEAVAYAHRNLVVHRDLKPGNILVSPDGSPHLLDFGIAKLLGPGVSGEAMIQTVMHVRLLTPEYASPEQVRGLPVTTASDVYLLGAILFELLTGRRAHQLTTYTPEEVSRVVCETEPGRPSSRLRQVERRPGSRQHRAHGDAQGSGTPLCFGQRAPSGH